MPYIKQEIRAKLNPAIKQLEMDLKINGNAKGNLNFAITSLILDHLQNVGLSYNNLSDIDGVLTDIQSEIYRRLVAPYEELKIVENGDLPDFQMLCRKIQKTRNERGAPGIEPFKEPL